MEKHVMIRITLSGLTLKEAADIEEKIAKVLDKYGAYEIEITALSSSVGAPTE